MLDGSRILVTGGTGSFGNKFIRHLLKAYNPEKIVIYSRNEANQCQMAEDLSYYKAQLRFIMGDVRDTDRLYRACKGIDFLVHAAALKVVPKAEYNPLEVTSVNVDGTKNVISAVCERGIKRAVFIGTDKAVQPVNLYGCTKAVAEKIWIEANYLEPVFSSVRYGNVMGSKGSVINKFIDMRERGEQDFPLTHEKCTRFWVDFSEAITLVLKALDCSPGLILATKTRPFFVRDLIKAVYLRAKVINTGLREGEKIHEVLVNEYEAARARDMGDHFCIHPMFSYDDTILYDMTHGKELTRQVVSSEYVMSLNEVRKRVEAFRAEAPDGESLNGASRA